MSTNEMFRWPRPLRAGGAIFQRRFNKNAIRSCLVIFALLLAAAVAGCTGRQAATLRRQLQPLQPGAVAHDDFGAAVANGIAVPASELDANARCCGVRLAARHTWPGSRTGPALNTEVPAATLAAASATAFYGLPGKPMRLPTCAPAQAPAMQWSRCVMRGIT